MFNKSFNTNEKNHLTMSGCDLIDIKEKYGTPLYVMDENLIRENCRTYKDAIDKYYSDGLVLYASKAFSCLYMYKLVMEEGLGVDVVSGGELYTALKAGFPAEKIYFHGNNKTPDELEFAIKENVGMIVVDNLYELKQIDEISKKYNKCSDIMFRIKPGIEAHTHEAIMTGQIDCKFGFAIENGEADTIIEEALQLKNVAVKGIHCHIGSQIFELSPFKETVKVMMNYIKHIKNKFNLECQQLNLGGGYGIKYIESDKPIKFDEFIKCIAFEVKKICKDENINCPKIILEPGRSIVGEAGVTLYTVGGIKDIKNVRKYISIDGGMGDNPRYALYDAQYEAAIANDTSRRKEETVTIAGKCCESGDLIAKDITMPEIEINDTLCVFSTGAYCYSMASNYNRIPRPPVVMVKNGTDKLIIKRETYENIISNDILDS